MNGGTFVRVLRSRSSAPRAPTHTLFPSLYRSRRALILTHDRYEEALLEGEGTSVFSKYSDTGRGAVPQ